MGRKKGTTKTGGRKFGTPNRRTFEFRKFLEEADFSIPQKILDILPSLAEEKQVDILVKLLAYAYPKYKTIEIALDGTGGPSTFAEWVSKVSKEYEEK